MEYICDPVNGPKSGSLVDWWTVHCHWRIWKGVAWGSAEAVNLNKIGSLGILSVAQRIFLLK